MKFETESALLAGALAAAVSCVAKSDTIPILSYVKIEAGDGVVRVTATDLERQMQATAPAEVSARGVVCLAGRTFATLVARLGKNATVVLEENEGEVVITSGRMRSILPTVPAEEFPDFKRGDGLVHRFELTADDVRLLFAKTQFCISNEETRYYLNGTYLHHLDAGSVLRAVATDGHKLARAEIDAPAGSEHMAPVIVPRRTVDLLLKMASGVDTISVTVAPAWVEFRMMGDTFVSKVIDGTYPDYTRVIPTGGETVVVPRAAVSDVLGRAAAMQSDRSGVSFEFSADTLELSMDANARTSGEFRETVDVSSGGLRLRLGLSVTYMQQVTAALGGDDVAMVLGDAGSAVRLHPLDRTDLEYVVMPMRI